jgi:phage-related protein (TIGR01555 family)
MTRLATAAEMPMTLLFGQSPAGMSATGESDIRFFYDRIKGLQNRKLYPIIRKLVEIELAARRVTPTNWNITFRPLRQASDKELAETKETQSKADETYIKNGVLSPIEVRQSRFGGGTFSHETVLDDKAFREYEEELQMLKEQQLNGKGDIKDRPDVNSPEKPQVATKEGNGKE